MLIIRPPRLSHSRWKTILVYTSLLENPLCLVNLKQVEAIYCFVYYKDESCSNITESRLIHTVGTPWAVECETKEVEGYKSYHFQPAEDVSLPAHLSTIESV